MVLEILLKDTFEKRVDHWEAKDRPARSGRPARSDAGARNRRAR
jgi:hypothetical protein